jgi:hypothetical protein
MNRPVVPIWSNCAGKQGFAVHDAQGAEDGVSRTVAGSVRDATAKFP